MDIAKAFARLFDGRMTPTARAELEQHLFEILVNDGADTLIARLRELTGFDFMPEHDDDPTALVRLVSDHAGRIIVVSIFETPELTSISVNVEDVKGSTPELNPAQAWFYQTWEALQSMTDPAMIRRLDPAAQAVYLVGLFETELMNGGISQYLLNTDGAFLDSTIEHLQLIGAIRSAEILSEAAQLGEANGAWKDIGQRHDKLLASLDDRFLQAGEDLAGLTASCFDNEE